MDAEDVDEMLNEYFASVFTQEKDMEDSEIYAEHANMLRHSVIKKEVVLSFLKSIKVDKSPGPNGIYPNLWREAREEIAGALTIVFVSSLGTGEVPEDWQVANVDPLFKRVIDEGRAVDVYMDFSNAFDKVSHGRLIQKIKMRGIH
eukprot:g26304.t1